MKNFLKVSSLSVAVSIMFSVSMYSQSEQDKKQIEQIISDQNLGWKNKDLDLTLKDYSEDVDWTNAFGDRTQGKEELKALLSHIYRLSFVMKGISEIQYNDIDILNPDIAVVHSKTVVKGQEWGDGTKMEDRHNYHQRVFHKKDGRWKVVSHLISQAWTKK